MPRYHRKRREIDKSWVAPEHARDSTSMKRDYPRDDFGRPIRDMARELIIDKRPIVMKQNA